MNPVSGIALYLVIWFMTLFVILPIKLTTQTEQGERVPGTPGSAPVDPPMRRKFKMVTIWASVVWAVIAVFIIFDIITLDDVARWTRNPNSQAPGG